MSDIFISYAREDMEFVKQLHAGLTAQGRDVWVDWEDIPPSAEWLQEIHEAIVAAQAVIFVISPDSVSSQICLKELAHAVANHKRLIPVVAKETAEPMVPEALSGLNWIFCREGDDFRSGLSKIVTALDTDLEWVHEHTRLLIRTAEWEAKSRDTSFLLRGSDLEEAERWLSRSGDKQPRPTSLQAEYVIAGRRATNRRQRLLLGGVTAGLCIAIVLASIAFIQRQAKEVERQKAVSRQLSVQALSEIKEGRLDTAMLLGIEATRTRVTIEARSSLLTALENQPRLQTFLHGHTTAVTSLVFSENATQLASGDREGRVMLWKLEERRGTPMAPAADSSSIDQLFFGRDALTLTALISSGLRFWDLRTGRLNEVPVGQLPREEVVVALSPDGKTLAAVTGDKNIAGGTQNIIVLLDRATGRPLGKQIVVDTLHVTDVAFSSDCRSLAAVDWSGSIWIWDVATQRPLGQPFVGEGQAMEGATEAVYRLAFSPDGRTLASTSGDRTITLWDTQTHRQRGSRISIVANVSTITFAPDSISLASGDGDGSITLWDVETHQPISPPMKAVSQPVRSLAFSSDGKQLASGFEDGTVTLWLLDPPVVGNLLKGKGFAFSPDGSTLVLGGEEGTITVVDTASLKPTRTLKVTPTSPGPDRRGTVATLRFSPDGRFLADSDNSGAIHLWDWTAREPVVKTLGSTGSVAETITFSRDSSLLFTAHTGGEVLLWDTVSGTRRGAPLAGAKSGVFCAAFSPDGRTVAFGRPGHGAEPGTIALCDVETRATIRTLIVGRSGVTTLVFSPDGRILAVGTDRGVVYWDTKTWKRMEPDLTGGLVNQVAFSSDGGTLAASIEEGIILWDTAARRPIGPVYTNNHGWRGIEFSPDGRTLALSSASDTLLLWRADMKAWQQRACRVANRNLTCSEWAKYGGDGTYHKSCPDFSGPERCE